MAAVGDSRRAEDQWKLTSMSLLSIFKRRRDRGPKVESVLLVVLFITAREGLSVDAAYALRAIISKSSPLDFLFSEPHKQGIVRIPVKMTGPSGRIYDLDIRNTLTPVALRSSGNSNDWLNEIHSNRGGHWKLRKCCHRRLPGSLASGGIANGS